MNNYTLKSVLILIGTGTAIGTQIEKIRDTHIADRQGYIFNNFTNQWDRSVICGTDGGQICTVNGLPTGQQAFGTSGPEVDHPETANVELYKIN